MRRRIWTELMPPDELGADATIALLRRYGLEPLVALTEAGETENMGRALRRLSEAGLRTGLWPLLSDADGYWPSEHNAAVFAERARRALAFAAGAGAKILTVAIDLEPPLATTRALLAANRRIRSIAKSAVESVSPGARKTRREAVRAFTSLRHELGSRGIETIAAVFPLVILDLVGPAPRIWQRILRTPAILPDWDVVSPMLYTSIMASFLPGRSAAAARRILFRGAEITRATFGPRRASVSLGLAGAGKLGDEPVLQDLDALVKDVRAARRAGIEDLALYSLEGVLGRERPEQWLDAFATTSSS